MAVRTCRCVEKQSKPDWMDGEEREAEGEWYVWKVEGRRSVLVQGGRALSLGVGRVVAGW